MRVGRFLSLASVFLAIGLGSAQAQPTPPSAPGEIRAEPEVQPAHANTRGHPRPGRGRATQAAEIRLQALSSDEVRQRLEPPRKGAPMQIGFPRDVATTRDEAAVHGLLNWETAQDGTQTAAMAFTSPDAAAIRVGLRVTSVSPSLVLRFYAPGSNEVFEVSGEEVLETIARNIKADGEGPDARTYWSPIIRGSTAVVELELAAGTRPQEQRFSAPQVSHIVGFETKDFQEKGLGDSASCEIDATCYANTWGTESNAVARMLYSAGGSTYQCTGTLLADNDASTTLPYFLSANHCISTQTVASTLQTWWFWRSTACGNTSTAHRVLTGGATLLYASGATDTSFMRLNTTPPAGVTYAGWIVGSPPAINTAMTGLHHPRGDILKITTAQLWSYYTCFPSGAGTFSCNSASSGSGTFLGVTFTSGITEPGSSGSGIFLNNGHYLVGQLYGGSSACGTSSLDFYGRFDVAYNDGIDEWLSPAISYSLTVAKSGTGTGTVTSSPAGVNCGSTCSASYTQGTSVTLTASAGANSTFSGWSGACSGTSSTCTVSMTAARSVTASFTTLTYLLAVAKQGTGTGTVTSSPSGIDCGQACSANFARQSTVTLTAAPAAGSVFTAWSGICSGTSSTCDVVLNGSGTAVATFTSSANLPGAPQNLAAIPGNGAATFTFTAPSSTGGSVITQYTVSCASGHAASGPSSPIAITGLVNGSSYSCSVRATSANGTGPSSASVSVTPSASAPMNLIAVRSRKFHSATNYDLPVAIGAPFMSATVDPREETTHRVVFSFSNPITFPGTLLVNDGTGTAVGAGSTASASGTEVIVTLAGVSGRRVVVYLIGVNSNISVGNSMGFLAGDVDGNGAVTSRDILRMKGTQGQAFSNTNFMYDTNRSATPIDSIDLGIVRSQAGLTLQ